MFPTQTGGCSVRRRLSEVLTAACMFDLPAAATTGKEYCVRVIRGALFCEVLAFAVPATEALERLGPLHTLHSLTNFESVHTNAHFTLVILISPLKSRGRCHYHVLAGQL